MDSCLFNRVAELTSRMLRWDTSVLSGAEIGAGGGWGEPPPAPGGRSPSQDRLTFLSVRCRESVTPRLLEHGARHSRALAGVPDLTDPVRGGREAPPSLRGARR
jgi:hypothetical protein